MDAAKWKDDGRLADIIGNGVSLVAFSAPWCAPCRFQNPIIARLVARYRRRARIVGLDVEAYRRSAMDFGITSIPTTILFCNGREIRRFVGLESMEVLSEAIDRVLRENHSGGLQ